MSEKPEQLRNLAQRINFTSYHLDYEALFDQNDPPQDSERSAAPMVCCTITQEYPHPWWVNISAEKALFQGQSYLFMKRVMDLTLIVLSMPIWLMIMGICGLLVTLDSPGGPAFFKQWILPISNANIFCWTF